MVTFGKYDVNMINEIILQSYIVGVHYGVTLQLPRNVALSYLFSGDDSLQVNFDMVKDLYDGANSRCRL